MKKWMTKNMKHQGRLCHLFFLCVFPNNVWKLWLKRAVPLELTNPVDGDQGAHCAHVVRHLRLYYSPAISGELKIKVLELVDMFIEEHILVRRKHTGRQKKIRKSDKKEKKGKGKKGTSIKKKKKERKMF